MVQAACSSDARHKLPMQVSLVAQKQLIHASLMKERLRQVKQPQHSMSRDGERALGCLSHAFSSICHSLKDLETSTNPSCHRVRPDHPASNIWWVRLCDEDACDPSMVLRITR